MFVLGSWKQEEGIRSFGGKVKVVVSFLTWVLGLNSHPLEEQYMLLVAHLFVLRQSLTP